MVKIGIAVIILTAVFVTAWIRNAQSKVSTERLVRQLKARRKDPETLAEELIATTATQVTDPLPSEDAVMNALKSMVDVGGPIYKFHIIHAERLKNGRVLLVTNCHEEEIFNERPVKRIEMVLFLLAIDKKNKTVKIAGDPFFSLNQKLNREEFGRIILSKLIEIAHPQTEYCAIK